MERQLERTRESEPKQTVYDEFMRFKMERTKQRREGKVVIRASEVPWDENRQALGKWYLNIHNWNETGAPGWTVIRSRVTKNYRIGKHTHRGGGRLLFCIEGRGYTVNNGIRMDWEPGDLETLPVVVGENEHEHFADPTQPQGFYVLGFWPFMEAVAYETRQLRESPDFKGTTEKELFRPDDFVNDNARLKGYDINVSGKPRDLLDALFLKRNQWRDRLHQRWVIREKDQPMELNRMGYYRWYVHPDFTDIAVKHILFWVHEIPPGSRSGKQKHQGGRLHFVLQGKGYTILDGKRCDWGPEDLIVTPINAGGCVFQHFNTDPEHPVKLAVAEPNWYDIMGVDLAAGFEQLENAPEYKP
ncbi:MAG: cupin domain-containing protein [Chloroflexi bacterium]|nr:cupin domain-containing protein [Chloroflexota bacterium]